MTQLSIISWSLTLSTLVGILLSVRRWPHLLVKPSFMVVVFFHAFDQWGTTILADEIAAFLREPGEFLFLAHAFPILTLLGSISFGHVTAQGIWRRLSRPVGEHWDSRSISNVVILWALVLALVALHGSQVPVSGMGLIAIFVDPDSAVSAREKSFALIDNLAIRYGVAWLATVVAPMLATMAIQWFAAARRWRMRTDSTLAIVTVVALMPVVSLTGQRGLAPRLMLTLMVAYAFRRHLRLSWAWVGLAGVVALVPPTIMSVLRDGHELSSERFFDYFSRVVLHRVFLTPVEPAIWHVDYAQRVGRLGIAAIPKLARLFDVDPVHAPNMIGLEYVPNAIQTIGADASFVFTYHSYFGMIAFLPCIAAVWALDACLLIYRWLSDRLLLVCVAVVTVACVSFADADFTTSLVTHGFLPALALCVILELSATAIGKLAGGHRWGES